MICYRAYMDIFTRNIYATPDYTFKNLKRVTNYTNIAVASGDSGKFSKVWNCQIFDLVSLAKVNRRKNVQFFGLESFSSRKIFFSPKASNYNILLDFLN